MNRLKSISLTVFLMLSTIPVALIMWAIVLGISDYAAAHLKASYGVIYVFIYCGLRYISTRPIKDTVKINQ